MTKNSPNLTVARPASAPVEIGLKVTSADLDASIKKRHWGFLFTFFLIVLVPVAASIYYLQKIALDQYHSVAAFSIRSEEGGNPFEALSAFTDVSIASAPDSEILHDFVQSQHIVEKLDAKLDLRAMFSPGPEDFIFALNEDATIEDMVDYWRRMVSVWTDGGGAIVNLEVRAFSPEDATAIVSAIVEESTALVNELSQIAQEDAMRFATEDLGEAKERLREIRQKVRKFRSENRIINPEADAESQMGVISALQARLAEILVRRSRLLDYAEEGDVRAESLDREIRAIRLQIDAERQNVAGNDDSGRSLSTTIGDYEELLVDLKFSEDAYTVALAAAEKARAEARRQSRYAAVHIPPTMAEKSIYPRRWLLAFFVTVAALSVWAILALVYYNIRDRS